MARKPSGSTPAEPQANAPRTEGTQAANPRERIVEGLMTLAAGRPWEEITLTDIAREADVSLADLRDQFPSKGAILGAFSRLIDRKVLEGTTGDLVDELARERLFDVLMRRIDAMTPYKNALRRIARALKRDPLALSAVNQVALNSQRYMLEAAGIDPEGPLGPLKLQGAVIAFGRTLETWFEDEDPGLARTLARLDRALRRGERFLERADDLRRLSAPLRAVARALCAGPDAMRRRFRERSRDRNDGDEGEDYSPAATI